MMKLLQRTYACIAFPPPPSQCDLSSTPLYLHFPRSQLSSTPLCLHFRLNRSLPRSTPQHAHFTHQAQYKYCTYIPASFSLPYHPNDSFHAPPPHDLMQRKSATYPFPRQRKPSLPRPINSNPAQSSRPQVSSTHQLSTYHYPTQETPRGNSQPPWLHNPTHVPSSNPSNTMGAQRSAMQIVTHSHLAAHRQCQAPAKSPLRFAHRFHASRRSRSKGAAEPSLVHAVPKVEGIMHDGGRCFTLPSSQAF